MKKKKRKRNIFDMIFNSQVEKALVIFSVDSHKKVQFSYIAKETKDNCIQPKVKVKAFHVRV